MTDNQDSRRPIVPPTPLSPGVATAVDPPRTTWTVIAAAVLVFLAAAPSAVYFIGSPWPSLCEVNCLGCFLAQKVIPGICTIGGGYLGVQLLRRRRHANWLAPLLLAVLAAGAWMCLYPIFAVSVPAPPPPPSPTWNYGATGLTFSAHTSTIFLLLLLCVGYAACALISGVLLLLPGSRRVFVVRRDA